MRCKGGYSNVMIYRQVYDGFDLLCLTPHIIQYNSHCFEFIKT